jgi:hypothetical protein
LPPPPPFEKPLPSDRLILPENKKIYSNCKIEKDILNFRSKTGTGREVKQYLACRSRRTIRPQIDSTPVKSPSNKRSRIPISPRRSPTHLRRGRNSQDNKEEAAARAYINRRRRAHRVADRYRESYSPLPSLNTAMATLIRQRQRGLRESRGGSRGGSRGTSCNRLPSSLSSQPRHLAPTPTRQSTPLYPASLVPSITSQVDQEDTDDGY